MIKMMIGKPGTGKTKHLIAEVNEGVKRAKGYVVYISITNNHMFQIDYRVRFTSMKDYQINDPVGFYGFISGIIASNYDVEGIYVDGLQEITNASLEDLEEFFERLGVLELKYNVNFIFSISHEGGPLPDYFNRYKIQQLPDIP